MKIIVDAMGGDNAPDEIVKGAVTAAQELGVDIILTGRGEDILRSLEKMGKTDLPRGIEIANAGETISMEEDAITGIREKSDSSMVVGLNMLKDGLADAMVSAGSTGALLSGATLIVKRVRGIRRAALAPFIPTKGKGTVIIDCGANAECTPEYLLQFAFMGSYYASGLLGIEKPRVGLLSNGTERSKGTQLQIDTHKLLESADSCGKLCFIGNVEAKEVLHDRCDVLVCDGFSGNILLKSFEGAFSFLLSEIKSVCLSGLFTKIGALFLKKGMSGIKDKMNPDKIGGTALLGISKPVIKAHGSSGAAAIVGAINQAVIAVNAKTAEKLKDNIESMKVTGPVE